MRRQFEGRAINIPAQDIRYHSGASFPGNHRWPSVLYFVLHGKRYPSLGTPLSPKTRMSSKDTDMILFFVFRSGRGEANYATRAGKQMSTWREHKALKYYYFFNIFY